MRKRWVATILTVIVGFTAIGIWITLGTSQAIVEAQVNLTAPYGNGFLAQVRTTHAFCKEECLFFEVWSKCSLTPNQVIDIKIPLASMADGGQPTSYEASLYKPSGVGFIPWDGC